MGLRRSAGRGRPGRRRQEPGPPDLQPDTSLKHIPGSSQEFTLAHIRDYWDVGDWFPDDHPAMPNVVVHGRQPHVRGCAMCHMPNGKGRPENAPVAGQSYSYLVQQLTDFKQGLRASADTRKTNTVQMIEAATDMTDDEIKEAAIYFSSMKWTPWITVREAAMVPKTRLAGNVFLPLPGTETEPIGNRIIEAPLDVERFELRDPRSGFIAYVPPGSLKKGAALVASGAGKTTPCGPCHGLDLNGLGPVPAIAGRSPSYLGTAAMGLQAGFTQRRLVAADEAGGRESDTGRHAGDRGVRGGAGPVTPAGFSVARPPYPRGGDKAANHQTPHMCEV